MTTTHDAPLVPRSTPAVQAPSRGPAEHNATAANLGPHQVAVRLVELGDRGIADLLDEAAMQAAVELLREDLVRLVHAVQQDINALPVHQPDREFAALQLAEARRLLGSAATGGRPESWRVAALARRHLSLCRCHTLLRICLNTPHPPLPVRRPGPSAGPVLADGQGEQGGPRCGRCAATRELTAVPGAVVGSGAAPEGWRCCDRSACWDRRHSQDGLGEPVTLAWGRTGSASGPLASLPPQADEQPEADEEPEVCGAR